MVDVNGNITPSGQTIEVVSADEWGDMSISNLLDQKIILNNRLAMIAAHGSPAMLRQINIGMMQLDAILASKEKIKYDKHKDDGLTGLI